MLKKEKFLYQGFGTLAEALETLRVRDCFCVILDVNVGDVPWSEALLQIRNVSHKIPVILTTVENAKELEAKARIEGVTYYYVKTFGEKELLIAIKEIFEARKKGGSEMTARAKKILVIDDDPDFQEAIKMILEKAGYKVAQAFTKEEGKKKVESDPPDLIILDIMLETETAGFHFLYEVISSGEKRKTRIPVLSVTSISEKTGFKFSPETDGDYFPADDYLPKPVKPDELLELCLCFLIKSYDGS
jgi:DNA-binding response OmpR family regulator